MSDLCPLGEAMSREGQVTDRIEYDGEFVDEFVIGNANVHLEMLDDQSLYIIAESDKHWWHFNVYHKGKSPLRVRLYEDNSDDIPCQPVPTELTAEEARAVLDCGWDCISRCQPDQRYCMEKRNLAKKGRAKLKRIAEAK